jgi:hypothetical protein
MQATGREPIMKVFAALPQDGKSLLASPADKDARRPSVSAAENALTVGTEPQSTQQANMEINKIITSILGSTDPLDGSEFDPIDYINGIFPNG